METATAISLAEARVVLAAVTVRLPASMTTLSPMRAVVAPVTVSVGDLQGATVDVALNQVININTGDLAVDSYTAEIADPSILEFVQGKEDGGATFNPGLKPLKVGTTEVTMTNAQGGIQPLTFTVKVTG